MLTSNLGALPTTYVAREIDSSHSARASELVHDRRELDR